MKFRQKNRIMVLESILKRKSVRHYTKSSISRDELKIIVKAGMAAPSANNLQPWHFIIIDSRGLLDKLAEGLPYAKMLYQASAAIAVCGTPNNREEVLEDYWVQDCSAATQNILLAVEALGYGAVWTGVFPRKERVDFVKKTLKIPDEVEPLNVIPIGKPSGVEKPKDKFDESKIHINGF